MSFVQDKIWTINDIILWGIGYLKEKNIDSPRLSIELLLCQILGLSRLELYLYFDKPLTPNELSQLKILLKRLTKGEPLQYILGWTQFLSYKILLNKKVFIPRPETEMLVNLVCSHYKHKKDEALKILDIGCGSGAITIALADFFKNSEVTAIDIDDNAIAQTEENIDYHKLTNATVLKLNILKELPEGKYDIIVSNPPYIPLNEYKELSPQVLKEPKVALTDDSDGLTFYRRFANIFSKILTETGNFYLEIGYNQADSVSKLFLSQGFQIKIEKDFQNIKRIIFSNRF
ncbi:MAG: Peptide chain release factor N(5)-glutamine methyltransferase [Candidatus Kapaibacterium sp.]|nr:MAG: Peptide chain release factor N(5)-glutamine methyltransferase [Candidatus Kapabacteria bacterium]